MAIGCHGREVACFSREVGNSHAFFDSIFGESMAFTTGIDFWHVTLQLENGTRAYKYNGGV
ncbi:hypothetical protein OESDEN_00675 [Oesophagostomum dentatum]|uniref:Uncharacterized protein n=1 Tax=Oesophagostomum dentatum TaxID=61180 RepID=A0A0B1TPY7_OESDE|nr:hypothetical protein OESDEN_00675 [Oesophagostomum dentatum]